MRRYGHLPGRKFNAARAVIGGVALLAGLFVAAGPAQAVGLSSVSVPPPAALAEPAGAPALGESVSPGATATAVQPGSRYIISDRELCSVGFAVSSATGQPGFATAGHCGAPGEVVQTPDGQPLGTFAAAAFPGTDHGWVVTGPQYATAPAVNSPAGAVAVHGSTPAAVGSPVCLLGQASGWHCGTITDTDQTVQYEQGLVSGLTATSVCSDAGDSGGVFLSGDQAQGIVSGGVGDCSDHGTTYFQPLAPVLAAYGLTLRTG